MVDFLKKVMEAIENLKKYYESKVHGVNDNLMKI